MPPIAQTVLNSRWYACDPCLWGTPEGQNSRPKGESGEGFLGMEQRAPPTS